MQPIAETSRLSTATPTPALKIERTSTAFMYGAFVTEDSSLLSVSQARDGRKSFT
jgi:hypothetical protein